MRGQMELAKLGKNFGGKFDPKSLDNPAVQRWLKDYLDRAKNDPKQDPERLKSLETFLKKPPPPPPANQEPEPKGGNLDRPVQGPGTPPSAPPVSPPPEQEKGDITGRTAPEDGLQERLSDWAQNMAHRLEGTQLGDRLRESPAWQKGMQALEG